MNPYKYFNANGEKPEECKLYGSNPDGFIKEDAAPRWAKKIKDRYEANTWFASEVSKTNEGNKFKMLPKAYQEVYKTVFAQLAANDSMQEELLLELRRNVTDKYVKACLTMQAQQETNHSFNYSEVLEITGISEEVFNLYRTNKTLLEKNIAISELFARYDKVESVSDMYKMAMTSVAMEGIFFLSGFSSIYVVAETMSGSTATIALIQKDEFAHMDFFALMCKELKDKYDIGIKAVDTAYDIINEAVKIELKYAKELLTDNIIPGLSYDLVKETVENLANDRLRVIGLDYMYPKRPKTRLQKLLEKRIEEAGKKENFFETSVSEYSKNSIERDDSTISFDEL